MSEITQAIPEDADDAGRLVTATDKSLFGYITDGRLDLWETLTAWEWRAPTGVYGYPRGRVVRDGGQIVAVLVAYTGAEHASAIDWTFACAKAGLPRNAWETIAARLGEMSLLFPAIPREAYYIQNIAVAESVRGTGLGRRLMEDAFTRGRQAGCTTCHLDVDSSTPAVQFYQRLGMKPLVRTELLLLPQIAAHLRMVIDL